MRPMRATITRATLILVGMSLATSVVTGLARAGAPGIIDTLAGAGTLDADGIPATDASIPLPFGITANAAGDVFISDATGCKVRRVSAGWISTVAGSGTCGYSGDGGPAAEAQLSGRAGLALDAAGNLYIADTFNCAIRRVDVETGIITTVAGGRCDIRQDDGVPATDASMLNPLGIVVHPNGDLYIAESMTCRVRLVSGGIITTVTGRIGADTCGFSGDGGPASEALVNGPEGLALDAAGDLYIADRDNCRIRKVSAGVITTVAGTGDCGYNGDGPALSASLSTPMGIGFDPGGGLLIADTSNCLVRRLYGGAITTVAGYQGSLGSAVYTECGYNGDDRPAMGAMIGLPIGVGSDGNGNVFFSEVDSMYRAGYSRVREIFGPLPPPPETDTDGDGCADVEEIGPDPALGGQRDPANPWDLYDVNSSKKVDAVDLGQVRSRFSGATAISGADERYDRSHGRAVWAPGPPDGRINAIDIALVKASFGHSCQGAP